MRNSALAATTAVLIASATMPAHAHRWGHRVVVTTAPVAYIAPVPWRHHDYWGYPRIGGWGSGAYVMYGFYPYEWRIRSPYNNYGFYRDTDIKTRVPSAPLRRLY